MCISSRNLWLEHGKGFKRAFLHILTQLCHTKRSLHNTRLLNAWYHLLLFFCNYIRFATCHLLFFNCYCWAFPSLPPSGLATAAWLFYIQSSHVIVHILPWNSVNYLSVASRVIAVHSNLYGDLSAPWIILEIWKCPQDVSEFSCYRNPRDLQDSD